MRRHKLRHVYLILDLVLTLLAALLAGGCGKNVGLPAVPAGSAATGGTETGNTTQNLTLRVIGYEASPPVGLDLPAIAVGNLQITSAKIVLDRIRFRPFSSCQSGGEDGGAAEVVINGPFVADLLQSSPLNGLEDI